jgi:Flp pilus assembly protein TadD/predicted aspartyl protease
MLAFSIAPIVIIAESTPASARSEIRLQLADLLFADERYWEALTTYENAKDGAKPEQLLRASGGLLRSLLQVAEFSRAYREAEFLNSLDSNNSELRSLYAEALWAFGLFAEAEQVYNEILAVDPANTSARHGIGRSLAARGQMDEGVTQLQAAISGEERPEYYHTLGTVFRRMHRYAEAADALEAYVNHLPQVRRTEKSDWARSEIRFLRSFGDRVPLQRPPDQLSEVHTIPFRLQRDKVIVRGRVNGGDVMDLVVDTGAEQMVMSKPSAQRVGVRPITNTLSAGVGRVGLRGLESGRVDTLEVGTLHISNVPTIIKNPPLSGLPDTRSENSFSPLALGLSTIIDYKNHHMIVADDLPDEPFDIEMPMRFHRLAMVRGIINSEHPKSFIVDTGGEVISISLSAANSLGIVPVRHIPLRVYGTSGWDQDAFLLPGVNLMFDRVQYDNFSVVVLNLHRPSALLGFQVGGIIGHKFLSNYRVALDLNHGLVRLTEL